MTDTGSNAAIKLARQWISHCSKHHTCAAPLPFFQYAQCRPARLLDIKSKHPHIRLVNANSAQLNHTNLKYAALSHCWGDQSVKGMLKTTCANVADRERGIDYGSLPRTFQDAVRVARELGFHLLWIDALCIVQDSPADWELEAAKMGAIYSSAAVTLAAQCSDGPGGGLFRSPGLPSNAAAVIGDTAHGRSRLSFIARYAGLKDPFKGHLSSRGWCFQENIMSPRVLHFTDSGIIWECRAESRSHLGAFHPAEDRAGCSMTKTFLLGDRDVFASWYEAIVPDYSRRRFTLLSDKSTALKPIVEAIRWKRQVGSFNGGVWDGQLAQGLAWSRVGGRGEHRHVPPTPTIPGLPEGSYVPKASWSWISHSFPVQYESQMESLYTPMVQLVIPDRYSLGDYGIQGYVNGATLNMPEGEIVVDRGPRDVNLIGQPVLDYLAMSQEVFLVALLSNFGRPHNVAQGGERKMVFLVLNKYNRRIGLLRYSLGVEDRASQKVAAWFRAFTVTTLLLQ
ncbi:heterokaryon incompatibility protein-domain-containing protein [Stachybotrys elegans]|uniref:Heterokaryon incompatibility protein-domain-containing protein n=1 Tax=Stachybotrys elegans TaxID=80388 RepID=A0A8K0SU57_9HYPO|nr:heterokaryon incompatibility protein-domain-containing protein [Stachybotrys elegans]